MSPYDAVGSGGPSALDLSMVKSGQNSAGVRAIIKSRKKCDLNFANNTICLEPQALCKTSTVT